MGLVSSFALTSFAFQKVMLVHRFQDTISFRVIDLVKEIRVSRIKQPLFLNS